MSKWSYEEAEQFVKFLTGLADLYKIKLNETIIRVYINIFQQYSFEDVIRAFEVYLSLPERKSAFFPKPGDIIQILDGDLETQALEAFETVRIALEKVGTYQSVKFDDPLITLAIHQLGDWVKLGRMETEEFEDWGYSFRKLYKKLLVAYKGKERELQKQNLYLPGVIEIENRKVGGEIPEPVLISKEEVLSLKQLFSEQDKTVGLEYREKTEIN